MTDLKQIKETLSDLLEPNPRIFWADMLASAIVGWTTLGAAIAWVHHPVLAGLFIVVSAMSFYRAIVFQHEIAHINRPWVKRFAFAWDLLIGIPFFMPSITYRSHLDHHRTKAYGTLNDPRYFFNGKQFRKAMILPVFASPFVFGIIAFRYLVLAPVSLLIGGRFRERVLTAVGFQKINMRYKPEKMTDENKRQITQCECACMGFWAILIAGVIMNAIPWLLVPGMAAVTMVIFICNHTRAFAAHLYQSNGKNGMTFDEQLRDSISIVGNCPLTPFFAPVGLRFHSLHHLVPTLPYHSMGRAHQRLMEELPEEHGYRTTIRGNLASTLVEVWCLHKPRHSSRVGATKAGLASVVPASLGDAKKSQAT